MRTRPCRMMYRPSPGSPWAKINSFSANLCSLSKRPILFNSLSGRSVKRSIDRSRSSTRDDIGQGLLASALAERAEQSRPVLGRNWLAWGRLTHHTETAFLGRFGLGWNEQPGELFDGPGVRGAAITEHQGLATTGGLVGTLASVRQLEGHRLLERGLELLARQHGERLVVVEHKANALEIEADDLAKHSLTLAHVAQRVQLGG